ncbi:TPA: serine--tRNA ligase [Candidatus Woesearchaeota archaeon]|nr:serine--tRNA ligase [Candidatus Woesearchaeota archaeon]HII68322.1 serine--tRNA ligase [Candidatus Woesearchaeota archaeon]
MLHINFIREHPDVVREDLKKRGEAEKLVWLDNLLKKDEEYKKTLQEEQRIRHKRNEITLEINKLKKEGKGIREKLEEAKQIPQQIAEIEKRREELQGSVRFYQMRLPNVLHESVPVGKDATENTVVREAGEIREPSFKLRTHAEALEKLGLADFETAANVSGNGFYYLFGHAAQMELALQRYAIDFLIRKGYTLVQPPFMLRREPYEGVVDLADFETMMYKIENEDLYLIATSEHPMGALFRNKTLDEKNLPIRYCGVSTCFRKEIGSHGIDEKGLFRVHQFNKIEQFIFCKPEDSWRFHEELLANAEELFKGLNLPYRVVNVCTGDIGIVAAKKYDLEVWMPREKEYKEVVSCSNCTSYQAVRLTIKYRKGNEKEYVHTLNSTAIATGRALRAIIEHCQQEDGSIIIPDVLQPYMDGLKAIIKA